MSDKRIEDKKRKNQLLNIVLAVVVSAFITFMITSTYFKSKVAETDGLLEKGSEVHVESAFEQDVNHESKNIKKLTSAFEKSETNIAKYSDTFNNVGVKTIETSLSDFTEDDSSMQIAYESTFENVSNLPIFAEGFEVYFQWDDEPSVSIEALASQSGFDDLEIDVEVKGIDTIIYPGEQFTLTYSTKIMKDDSGDYGLFMQRSTQDYGCRINYSIHSDDM